MALLIRRGQNFAFIDIIDLQRFDDLRFDKMADSGLRHDRDRNGFFNCRDHRRIRHPCDSAVFSDVRGHAFERHDRHGACLFGDFRLLHIRHIHDDAAL